MCRGRGAACAWMGVPSLLLKQSPSPPQPHLVFAAHPAEPRLTALPGFVIIMEKNPLGIPTHVLLLVLLCPVGLGGSGRAVQ